jgi:hypothetical protein
VEPEKAQDEHHDDDYADEIDDAVHEGRLACDNPSADCAGSDEEPKKTALHSEMFRAAAEFCIGKISQLNAKLRRCGNIYIFEGFNMCC